MITNEYIDSLGIDQDKADALKTALKKDSFYRNILYKVGVMPGVIENIMRMTDTSTFEEDQAEILTEKARCEWRDFIPASKRK